jgi:capsular exopolysaccharide synthesis family protein
MIKLCQFLTKAGAGSADPNSQQSSPLPRNGIAGIDDIPTETVAVQPTARLALLTDPYSPTADRFRYFKMRLRELRTPSRLRTIVITSPLPKDGKSTAALNLTTALADRGAQRVLLIDADLHCSSIARTLGAASPSPGLAECLHTRLDPMKAVKRLEPLHWYLLGAGEAPEHPSELLNSPMLPDIIAMVSSHFDWVIVDTPPLAPLSDALLWSRQCDSALLVVRAGKTPREAVEEALALLKPTYVAGIILNGAEDLNTLYSKYSGYYRYNTAAR